MFALHYSYVHLRKAMPDVDSSEESDGEVLII